MTDTVTYSLPVIEDRKMYGIWLPGEGWLKGKDVFADYDLSKAQQVARLIGRGAVVRFIDKSILDFERHYLEQEKRTLWHIFRNYFKRKPSK